MEQSSQPNNSEKSLPDKIFTLANVITVLGGFLTCRGLRDIDKRSGLLTVALGRGLDLLDGTVARKANQASELGAALDAATDKLTTAKLLYELWRKDMAPKEVLGAIATFNAISFLATVFADRYPTGEELRPTKSGKLAIAIETGALIAYGASDLTEKAGCREPSQVLRKIGHATFALAVPLAINAFASYINRAIEHIETSAQQS